MVIAFQAPGWRRPEITWEIDAHDVDSEQIAKGREALYDRSLRACDHAAAGDTSRA